MRAQIIKFYSKRHNNGDLKLFDHSSHGALSRQDGTCGECHAAKNNNRVACVGRSADAAAVQRCGALPLHWTQGIAPCAARPRPTAPPQSCS